MAAPKHANAAKSVYSAAHFTLELDGIGKSSGQLPTLRSVEGGGVKADVVNYQMGENGDIWRQLGKPKYDDIKMTLGLADAGGFWDWIKEFLAGKPSHKNGAIVAADYNFEEKARREFEQALIVGLGLPKWDANAKEQANVTITMAVEKVVFKPASGSRVDTRDLSEAKQKHIAACNFRFSVDGFEDACARTAKVDAMELKVKTIEHHHGNRLEPIKLAGKFELPNLVFYVPEDDAKAFRDLHNERMAGTRKDQGQGLSAKLSFYNNNKVEKGEFEFKGVHIFNVSSEKNDASSEELKLVKIEAAIESVASFVLK